MKILEYDDVDLLSVLHLTLLTLDFTLMPKRDAHIRRIVIDSRRANYFYCP